jgi:hypothetical protein
MANSSLTLSSIDFDTLKTNFKEFLKTQSVFKDFDYEGSNINTLLDVMSYNSYLNSFYLNMTASEMFLDSAQQYDSIVSHAKELNYIPRSATSSSANVTLTMETSGITGAMSVPKGTRFSGTNSNGVFVYTTNEAQSITSGNTTYALSDLTIKEGDYLSDTYVVDGDIERQQFLINTVDVDTSSITVHLIENNGASNTEYTKKETLFGLGSDSGVFFVQASQNNLYEIVFGDGTFGKKPTNGSTVLINYRVSTGADADGINIFTLLDDLGPTNSGVVSSYQLTVNQNSGGGSAQEDAESIRFAAPRYFATQQRAVTNDDYSSLVLAEFSDTIDDVNVYGGQELETKLYGRVAIALNPIYGEIVPDYIKTDVKKYLEDYIALPNRVVLTDPEYIYCSLKVAAEYDNKVTDKSHADIASLISSKISAFTNSNLEKFGKDLRMSKLVSDIDAADSSVTSNFTINRAIKRIAPPLNVNTTFDIQIGNSFDYDQTQFITSEVHSSTHSSDFDLISSHATVLSSFFTYTSKAGGSYQLAFIEDDDGVLGVYYNSGSDVIKIDDIGAVDYATGRITINDLNVSSYTDYISLYCRILGGDIRASQNKILVIDPADVSITITETRI